MKGVVICKYEAVIANEAYEHYYARDAGKTFGFAERACENKHRGEQRNTAAYKPFG